LRANEDLNILSAPLSGYMMVFLNLDAPLLGDLQIRQALLYALNRQALVNRTLAGQGIVTHSPIPAFSWAYNPEIARHSYDPALAASLLEQAGWLISANGEARHQGGQRLSFALLHPDREPYAAIAAEIARQWAIVGVEAVPQAVSAAQLVNDYLRQRDYVAALYEWKAMPPDPDLYALWHSTQARTNGQNLVGLRDDMLDILLEEGRLQFDSAIRKRLYDQFQQRFAEQVPALPLFHPVYNYVLSRRVHDVQIGPLWTAADRFRGLDRWYVQTRRVAPHEAQLIDEP
jgi:peptide/nickel transport system substrate-binding protein